MSQEDLTLTAHEKAKTITYVTFRPIYCCTIFLETNAAREFRSNYNKTSLTLPFKCFVFVFLFFNLDFANKIFAPLLRHRMLLSVRCSRRQSKTEMECVADSNVYT